MQCRITTIHWRQQTKQDTASNEGATKLTKNHIILTKYEEANRAAVPENYSS